MLDLLHDHEVRAEGFTEGRNEGRIEGRIEGIVIGEQRGRSEMMNFMLELMRKNGFSPETINDIKTKALNS